MMNHELLATRTINNTKSKKAFFSVILAATQLCEGGLCPSTHPFAFSDGKKCCATAMENGYKGDVETCNAGYLDLRSTCCAYGLDVLCKQEPCTDFRGMKDMIERVYKIFGILKTFCYITYV